MKKLTIVACLTALLFGVAAGIQQQQPTQRKIPEFEKHLQVNLVLLDLIVLNRNGKYVHGLTADDFIAFEDGKEIEIKSVDEYFLAGADADSGEAGRTIYDSPPRNIIFIFDRLFSSTYALKRGKKALIDFIQNKLQPGDRAMILTFDRTFRVVQDLTSDRKLLSMAAMGVKTLTASDDTPEMTQNIGSDADAEFRLSSTDVSSKSRYSPYIDPMKNIRKQNDIRVFLEKLQLLAQSFKSLPGRKAVILLSEGYDERLIHSAVHSVYTSPDYLLDEAEVSEQFNDFSSDASGHFQTSSLLSIYSEMVSDVNDSSTSFYVVDLAIFGGQRTRADQEYKNTTLQRADYQASRLDSLAALADTTGGKLYSGGGDLSAIMDKINSDISNYYIIAYSTPNTRKDGKFRKVKISTKNKAFTVRTRKGYFEPKRFEKLNNKERYIHLMEGFFRSNPENELEADSSVFFLPLFQDTVVGAISIEIPAEKLGDKGDQTIEIIANVVDRYNKRVDAFHRQVSYGERYNEIKKDGVFRIRVPLAFASGFNRLNLVVRDNCTGKRYFIVDEYITRGTQPDDLYISSIALFDESNCLASSEKHKLKVVDMGAKSGHTGHNVPDPVRLTVGKPIFPYIHLDFSPEESPVIFFSTGNFWQDKDSGQVDFFIDYTVTDAEGNQTIIPVVKERFVPIPGTSRLNVLSQLLFSGLQAGEYKLRVRFLDRKKLQGVQRELPITIK